MDSPPGPAGFAGGGPAGEGKEGSPIRRVAPGAAAAPGGAGSGVGEANVGGAAARAVAAVRFGPTGGFIGAAGPDGADVTVVDGPGRSFSKSHRVSLICLHQLLSRGVNPFLVGIQAGKPENRMNAGVFPTYFGAAAGKRSPPGGRLFPVASSSVERVQAAAASAGVDIEIVEFPDGTRTAEAAAAAVGCAVDQIVKSMVFAGGEHLILALTSGVNRVNPNRLAAVAGVVECARADADRVRAETGFAIGGVAPFGHVHPVQAVLDPHLLTFDRVWAAAGTPRHVFGIEPVVLQRLAGATVARFTA